MPRSSSEKDGKPAAADASSQNPVGGKQWKREIKRRLRREALLEIRPLAVGTLAMIGSALCNQGKFILRFDLLVGFFLRAVLYF